MLRWASTAAGAGQERSLWEEWDVAETKEHTPQDSLVTPTGQVQRFHNNKNAESGPP
jgi:hypothetical protein